MKNFWQSKQFWVSAITILVGAFTLAKDVIPTAAWPYIVLLIGILNLVLRSISGNEAITYGKKSFNKK